MKEHFEDWQGPCTRLLQISRSGTGSLQKVKTKSDRSSWDMKPVKRDRFFFCGFSRPAAVEGFITEEICFAPVGDPVSPSGGGLPSLRNVAGDTKAAWGVQLTWLLWLRPHGAGAGHPGAGRLRRQQVPDTVFSCLLSALRVSFMHHHESLSVDAYSHTPMPVRFALLLCLCLQLCPFFFVSAIIRLCL